MSFRPHSELHSPYKQVILHIHTFTVLSNCMYEQSAHYISLLKGRHIKTHCEIGISSFPGVGYIRFSLRGITYQNNSLVTLEDIGEDYNALLCITEQIGCCRSPYTGYLGPPIGNWFFPNGTGVPNYNIMWEFYRNRRNMVLNMHRRRGGENGIYHCEIPDTAGIYQIVYIGVYTAGTGEQCKIYLVCFFIPGTNCKV